MSEQAIVQQFLTEEEYAQILRVRQAELAGDPTFAAIASAPSTPKEFSRKEVVRAFQRAFELIGGVPRMAIWADANPTEFYKLYARMLPSQASSALGESNEMVVRHVIARSPLDA